MLIAAGMALLLLIFGAPQNDLLILKMDKHIKKYVLDKSRKGYILTEIKTVKKLQKSYQKVTKKHTGELKDLVAIQSTTKDEFDTFYVSLLEYEVSVNKEFIPHRIKIQDAMTDEEWVQVLDASEKAFNKSQKNNQKTLAKLKKGLDKSKNKIQGIYEDSKKRETAGVSMDDFSTQSYDFAVEILGYNQYEEDILMSKHASNEELKSVVDEYNKQWIDILNAFAELHVQLAAISSESEWKSVIKVLKKKMT